MRDPRGCYKFGFPSDYTEAAAKIWQAVSERPDTNRIRLLDKPAYARYTITLGPGLVRYMKLEDFLERDVEDTIAHLRAISENPEFEFPAPWITPGHFDFRGAFIPTIADSLSESSELDLQDIDAAIKAETWDARLRTHHTLCRFCLAEAMPSCVYARFHELLRLQALAPDECLKAWVRQAFENDDIANSYENDPGHVVLTLGRRRRTFGLRRFVFIKTPFVLEKLNALQQNEAEQKTQAEAEILRRSKFNCFIYLMEDLRNRTFKIGRSKSPGKRERTLQSEVPQVVMRFSIPAEEEQERQLHSRFACRRSRGEWFDLANEDLLWIVAYLKANGDSSRAMVDYNWLDSVQFAAAPNTPGK